MEGLLWDKNSFGVYFTGRIVFVTKCLETSFQKDCSSTVGDGYTAEFTSSLCPLTEFT
jgi:hypothetical protein